MEGLFDLQVSVQQWIEDQLGQNPSQEQLSTFAIKLQMLEQDLESTLQYRSNQLLQNFSNSIQEIDYLQQATGMLSQKVNQAEQIFENISSSFIRQLKQDYKQSQKLTICKSALQEIEFFDTKAQQVEQQFQSNNASLTEITQQVSNMLKTLECLPSTDIYQKYWDKLEGFVENLIDRLQVRLDSAIKSWDTEELTHLSGLYQQIGKYDKFGERLRDEKIKLLCELSWSSDDFLENLVQSVISATIDFLKICKQPQYLSEMYGQVFQYHKIQNYVLGSHDIIKCFNEQLIPLATFIEDHSENIEPLLDIFQTVSNKFCSIEKARLQGINQRIGRNNRNYIQDELFREIQNSWNRCIVLSFDVQTIQWIKEIEQFVNKILWEFKEQTIENPLADSNWDSIQSAIQQYEFILTFRGKLLQTDKDLRQNFIQMHSTALFSQDKIVYKKIQQLILNADQQGQQQLNAFTVKLREGGYFLAGIINLTDRIQLQYRDLVLNKILSPIKHIIDSYHQSEIWIQQKSQFSLSPSHQTIQVGEHLLLLVQQLEPGASENDYFDIYSHEFAILPQQKLPHSIGIHFWLAQSVQALLSMLNNKILQIKQFTEAGVKQLITDITYLLNVIKTFEIESPLTHNFSKLIQTAEQKKAGDTILMGEVISN